MVHHPIIYNLFRMVFQQIIYEFFSHAAPPDYLWLIRTVDIALS